MKHAKLIAVGAGALVLAYAAYRVKSAAGAAGAAITGAAGTGWTLINVPVWDASMPGAGVANAIVASPANTLDALSFGTVGGSTGPGSTWYEALKAGPLGGLVGIVSGDGNTNIFGPAPAAGLDFGNGTGNWKP
jgi:hypothetical protein